ncbi:MAG: amino acid ABC transporter substrate-binding protein [Chloroflexi bacterium]|nr:MAG: amino acid ABC transporter substrate-binding protein [Chloroflexota bacterium]
MRRSLWLVLTVSLVLSVIAIACAQPVQQPAAPAAEEKPAAQPQPKAEEAGVIKLGAAISFTGKKAREGKLYIDAYNHAVDYINEHGGVKVGDKTYKFELVLEDDESDATKSSRLVEKLITEDKVDFLLGPYSSGITIPDSAVAEKYGVPMIEGGGASGKIFSRGFKYIFGTLPSAANYFQSILNMAQTLDPKPKTIALLYADDEFDIAVAEGTRKLATEMGYELIVDEEYPSGTQEFSTLLSRVKSEAPDMILVAGHAEESLVFVQQAKELKVNAGVMAFTVGPPTPDFREALGEDAEYIYGVPSWTPSLNFKDTAVFGSTAEWIKLFQDKYGYEPDYHVASGVADVVVYKAAIEKAGTLDRDAVRDAIASIEVNTIYGPVKFQENGQIGGGTVAIQIQNGEVVAVYPESVAESSPIYPMPAWEER